MIKKGFTLIELLVIVMLIGIILSLGFINYVSVVDNSNKTAVRSNHEVLVEAILLYSVEHSQYPTTLADVSKYFTVPYGKSTMDDSPKGAVYTWGPGITGDYMLHSELYKGSTLIYEVYFETE